MSLRLTLAATLLGATLASTLAAAQDQSPATPATPAPNQPIHQMPTSPGTDMASFCAHVDLSNLAHFYPAHARDLNIQGQTTLECALNSDNHFDTCWLLSETPPGENFGAAAMRLACVARQRAPDTHTSFHVDGDSRPHVTFPLNFRLAGDR